MNPLFEGSNPSAPAILQKEIPLERKTRKTARKLRPSRFIGMTKFWVSIDEYNEARQLLEQRFDVVTQEGIDLNDGADTDVHTEHCCVRHGCKYGEYNYSVVTRAKRQSYRCLRTGVCYELYPDYNY